MRIFFLIILSVISFKTWSQNITGQILDVDKTPLEFVAVAVLNPDDSILLSYATTDQNGFFELTQISKGKIIFQTHLVGYKIFQKTIDYQKESIDFGSIILESENLLDEIVITAVTPVSIKNDTISYDTRAFKVRPDDSVEDLIKKLPDMEVDANGKVFAQGEQITRIYIDGKEFFSNDPSIAIKNLSADVISKIEVIDESTNESRISGVSDSQRPKVLNIKLKKDHKVNAFGKFQGGYGTDNRYLTSLNYNRFTPKVQATVIGKYNNVNSLGSDISELLTFDDSNTKKKTTRNTMPNSGFITTGIAATNLGYEFKKKRYINIDYIYNNTKRESGDVFTKRTEYIKDQEIKTERATSSYTDTNNHETNFNYIDRANKLNSFELRGKIGIIDTKGYGTNSMDKFNGNGDLDLQSEGATITKMDRNSSNIQGEYVARFNENSKRNLVIKGAIVSSEYNTSNLNSQLNTYKISQPDKTYQRKLETYKEQESENLSSSLVLKFNEPLADKHLLSFDALVSNRIKGKNVNQTKHIDDVLDTPLIYEMEYDNDELRSGITYKYDNKKLVVASSALFSDQTLNFGVIDSTQYNTIYKNFIPSLSIRYRPSRGRLTLLRFKKSINLPTLTEVTPIVNDFNSLKLSVGNPNLTPEQNYNTNLTLNRFYFKSGVSIISKFDYNYIENTIVKTEFTDDLGVRTTSFDNYGTSNSINFNVNFRKRLKPIGIRLNASLGGNYRSYITIINDEINKTESKTGKIRLTIENDKKNKVDAIIGVFLNKNFTTFSSVQNVDRDFLQQTYYAKTDWYISEKLNLNTQFKYDIYTDSNFETAQKIPLWNATIAYGFSNSRFMNLKFTALDILNKNVGLVRSSSDNYFQEIQREVLGTYYMLSLTYNLNGNKS